MVHRTLDSPNWIGCNVGGSYGFLGVRVPLGSLFCLFFSVMSTHKPLLVFTTILHLKLLSFLLLPLLHLCLFPFHQRLDTELFGLGRLSAQRLFKTLHDC